MGLLGQKGRPCACQQVCGPVLAPDKEDKVQGLLTWIQTMFPVTPREDWWGELEEVGGHGGEPSSSGESRWAGPRTWTHLSSLRPRGPRGHQPDRVSACERPVPTADQQAGPQEGQLPRTSVESRGQRPAWRTGGRPASARDGVAVTGRPPIPGASSAPPCWARGWCGRGWRRLCPHPALLVSPGGQVAAGLAGTGCPRAPPALGLSPALGQGLGTACPRLRAVGHL